MKNNAFQGLSVSEVVKFVELILLVRATNFFSERLCSTLHRVITYLRSLESLRTETYPKSLPKVLSRGSKHYTESEVQ